MAGIVPMPLDCALCHRRAHFEGKDGKDPIWLGLDQAYVGKGCIKRFNDSRYDGSWLSLYLGLRMTIYEYLIYKHPKEEVDRILNVECERIIPSSGSTGVLSQGCGQGSAGQDRVLSSDRATNTQ